MLYLIRSCALYLVVAFATPSAKHASILNIGLASSLVVKKKRDLHLTFACVRITFLAEFNVNKV